MAIIVQPDKFFHQQKINFDLIMEGYEFRTLLVSLHKLSKYIDISQLPEIFGGTFTYDAEKWCDERERIEAMMAELNSLSQDVIQANGRFQIPPDDPIIAAGRRLIADLRKSGNVHHDVAAKALKNKISEIEHLASLPQKEAELSKVTAENEERCRMLEEHAEGVNRLLDWIEGPGEKWLLTLHEIGENKDEARQLVKEHQQLALKSKVYECGSEMNGCGFSQIPVYETHALAMTQNSSNRIPLLGKSTAFKGIYGEVTNHPLAVPLWKTGKEIGRSSHCDLYIFSRNTTVFRGVLHLSLAPGEGCNLCEIVSQADELAELASRLMAAVPAHSITLEKAREQVRALARQYANRVERQTGMARQSEEFHTRVSDLTRKTDVLLESLCTDLMMNDLAAVESEKSNLEEKVSAMEKTYESVTSCASSFIEDLSAEEMNVHGKRVAIKWLEELHETLLKDYNQMGGAEDDLRHLREDRMKLEETARSTYEYGRQLCQVALVLRRSLRMDVKNQVNHRIEELGQRVSEVRDSQLNPERICAVERRRLNNDIQELRHIADMLIAQVNANHNVAPEVRQAAITSIRKKVDGVDTAHRRMESLFVEAAGSSRSQSTQRLSVEQHSPSEEMSRPYYHITGMARRPSGHSLPSGTIQPLGSIRLSDTESYL
ncbi:hypothetical protein TELCIR_12382 [Teladorsagia circumcincta]|uniref:CRAL-TRIO domain-containing protein n=1 Tax=Teladorsagia circumcincta TaxID=45464 RepID=A0A2G9U899_TELCI|nr:hypothetical protein TELCIR_12382 [Teladorsagia circumcincta]